MPVNIVPMSTDAANPNAGVDPLVQAMMAQRQQRMSQGQRMMEAGSRPQPVFNTAQGMMMLANGALGGFLEGRDERNQKEAQRQAGLAIGQLGKNAGLSDEQTRALTALAIVNPAAVGPMIAQMSQRMFAPPQAVGRDQRLVDPRTGRITTDSEPNFQRVGPGETLVDPRQLPRAPAGGAPQGMPQAPQAAPQGGPPAPQPGVVFQGQGFRTLTPQDRIREGILETDRRVAQYDPSGKIIFDGGAPQTSVTANVNTVANPYIEAIGKQFGEQRDSASSAANTIRTIHAARSELDKGILSGPGADVRLGLARVGAQLGITDPAIVNNTEAFRSAVGRSVLDMAKTLGANPSNADREFIQSVMGGSISLNDQSLRRILDIQEDMARGSIERYNQSAGKVIERLKTVPGADPNMLGMLETLGPIGMPAPYQPPQEIMGAPQGQAPMQAPLPEPRPDAPPQISLDAINAEIQRRIQMQQQEQQAPPQPGMGNMMVP